MRLVFVTKYRRKVCEDSEAHLIEMDGEADHVHLLVNSLKGASSQRLRTERSEIAKRYCWRGALRRPSYFAASCGGAPISVVRQYIEQQATPA